MDWNKIKAEYIAGGTSYRKLAEKYKTTLAAVRNVAQKEKWVELKAQAQHKADTKMVESVSSKTAKRATNIVDVADKLLDKIAEIVDAVDDTQSIKHLTSALKDLKEIKGFKSKADMKEQEARIKKLLKEAEKEDEGSRDVVVKLSSELEEYSE